MGSAGSQATLADLVAALRAYVEYQRELGVSGYPRGAALAPPRGAPPPERIERVETPSADLFTTPGLATTRSLEELRAFIGDCQRCKLAPHRTQLVFGVGNPRARLV